MQILLWVLLVAVLALLAGTYFAYRQFFRRNDHWKVNMSPESMKAWESVAEDVEKGLQWVAEQPREEVSVTSYDGLTLKGWFLPVKNAKRTVLCVHGYHGNCFRDFAGAMRIMMEHDCNILTIHQRSQGESEGHAITMGQKESRDCQTWTEYLQNRLGKDHPVFLDGVSMGCTTVLLASALSLPENVKGIIADCGYTSGAEIVAHVMRDGFHLPVFPLLALVEMWCRLCGGFSLYGSNVPKVIGKNTRPILFAHGQSDSFVPWQMGQQNYDACQSEKSLLLVPEAEHCMSFMTRQKEYICLMEKLFSIGEKDCTKKS